MKQEDIKKQLIVESGIAGAILLASGIGLFGLNMLNDSFTHSTNELKTAVNNVSSQMSSLYSQYSKVQQNGPLYKEAIEKLHRGDLMLSRETVRDAFNQFNSRYYLSGLRVVMSGIDEPKDAKFRRKHYAMVSSPVVVNFDAVTDEDVYNMINTMETQLPGGARISKFVLNRVGTVNDDTVQSVTQTGLASMVRGEIDFTWYGIKTLEVSEPDAKTPSK